MRRNLSLNGLGIGAQHYDQFGRVANKLDQAGTEILRYSCDPNDRLTNRWSAAKGIQDILTMPSGTSPLLAIQRFPT